jgi:hypothetical protein
MGRSRQRYRDVVHRRSVIPFQPFAPTVTTLLGRVELETARLRKGRSRQRHRDVVHRRSVIPFQPFAPTVTTLLGRVGSELRRAAGEGRFAACVRGLITNHRTDPPRGLVTLVRDPPQEGGIGDRKVAKGSIATATPRRCSSTLSHSLSTLCPNSHHPPREGRERAPARCRGGPVCGLRQRATRRSPNGPSPLTRNPRPRPSRGGWNWRPQGCERVDRDSDTETLFIDARSFPFNTIPQQQPPSPGGWNWRPQGCEWVDRDSDTETLFIDAQSFPFNPLPQQSPPSSGGCVRGSLRLLTVPPHFARNPKEILLPKEVVEKDR